MHAIFRDGGRQYRVAEGDTLLVDLREGEPGSNVEFGEVLSIEPEGQEMRIGQPLVEGARVVAEVIGEYKGPKLIFHQFRRTKNSRTRRGHRQKYTQVRIAKIEG
ncbi:MAG: 50S ribosomal protein L21 [Planctomycetota bacterium]|jgi:large subunit ribosomal protein L21